MTTTAFKIDRMAKRNTGGKPPDPPSGKKPNRKPAYIIYARVDPVIGEAWEKYLAETEPEPTVTAALELALKRFLRQEGYLPSPPPKDGGA